MIRALALLALAVALGGCATETRVIQDNSASAKFARMFGGNPETSDGGPSGGWTVVSHGGKADGPTGPVSPTAMKIAELLKNQANAPRPVFQDRNPGNWKVTTSFPTDAQEADPPAQKNVPLNPTPDPWGAAPAPALPGSVMPAVPTATPSR